MPETSGSVERLRVLRLIARLNVGGPALQAAVLSDGLDPGRFEQLLLAGSVGPAEGDYVALRAPYLHVSHVEGLGRAVHPCDDLRALKAVVGAVRRFRPHVLHTHTAKAGVLGRLAARMCGVPATVHTFHGHLLSGYFSPPVREGVVQAERMLARGTTRLVAVGDQVRRDLLAAGIGRPEQYSVVAPGIRLGVLPPKGLARAELDLPPHTTVATLVARLTKVKRPERFIDVASLLGLRHPGVLFVVAGEGELAPMLARRAAEIGAPVRFLGWRSDMETVYSASDIVVVTSDNEGMPVSLIEAQMAGRPCVTTRAGAAPEVVADGRTGFVTGMSPAEIGRAVERLVIDQDLRTSMGAAAHRRAEALFGAERLVADVGRIYEEVAGADRVAEQGHAG